MSLADIGRRANCDTPVVARRPRQQKTVFFRADDLTPVTNWMAELAIAEDGWVNMVPRMSDDEDDQPTSLGFLTLFGGGGAGLTMCTWIPGRRDQTLRSPSSLGIAHVTGHRAVAELASRNTAVPESWVVEQDHPFRGLVLRVPSEESHEVVASWALRAVRALGTPRAIRGWRADIFLPLTAP